MRAYLIEIQVRVFAAYRHHVRGEHGTRSAVFGNHQAVSDRRMRRDYGLDLAEFDAVTADLDLLVGASDEFQLAGNVAADQVSRSIQSRAPVEWVGDESLRGQPWAPQISARQLSAAEVQLTDHLGRHRLQLLVEHVGVDVAVRRADRHHTGAMRSRNPQVRRADHGLCRAVVVSQLRVEVAGEFVGYLTGKRLPAHRHVPQLRAIR